MPHAGFVHLRVRSAFSLLEGAVRMDELAKRCRAEAMPAVAVTDHANLFGAMQFCGAATKAGVQPILGALLPLAPAAADAGAAPRPPARGPGSGGKGAAPPEHLLVLVKDAAGWRNLSRLLSRAYLASDPAEGVRIEPGALDAAAEGLICLTGGPGGPVGAALARGEAAAAEATLARLKAAFGDRLYVELHRHGLDVEASIEPALVDLADAHGVPLVATNDVHFLDASMHEAHDVLLCLAQGAQLAEPDRRRVTLEHRFKAAAEMAALFADLPDAVANTLEVARRCAFEAPARPPILPTFAADEEAEMRRLAAAGLERRLAAAVWDHDEDGAAREAKAKPYRERLAYELDVIAQMKFPGYFLIVSDFIRWAKGRKIPVGPGRGSGAGSVVAWALEITDLDPLRFGLLFERFLNPERVSMPDFDIDFCEERRGEVIAYVRDRYGADRVAQIITFGTLQPRAALRDVGRVLGLPFGLVDRICKLVPVNPANPVSLPQALALEPRLKQHIAEDPAVARMVEIALKLEGMPRNASTHAAGIVIGDRPLEELAPLYRDPRAMLPATQFNMKDVEKAGLVKFDFLGLSTLTLLELAEKLVNDGGTPLELARLPLDDRASYEVLARAETQGIFQLESGGMKDALRKLKPDSFGDIVAMVSLYRPGPMDNIPRYTNVKHGQEAPEYLHPMLKPILEETNGVIIYQEQVMEIARRLAGYTMGGADLLRRAMGKKIKAEMDAQREVFVAGAVRNGIEAGLANTIFDAVAKFASYGFNKSHAACYAILAYQTAYLKANHPVEFYAAAMTTEMANQEKLAAFRGEMTARGLPLYPPDVNASGAKFSVERGPEGPGVRFALAAIKGVGLAAMEAVVAERDAGGPYADAFDLACRAEPRCLNKRLFEALAKAGAFDALDPNRRRACESSEPALRHAASCAEAEAAGQASLFGGGGGDGPARPPAPPPPEVEDWPVLERLSHELDVLGLYLSAHPLDGWKDALGRLAVVPVARLRALVEAGGERQRVRLAGVVTAKQEKVSERGRFAIVQLSDPSGSFEVRIFSELLGQARELLEGREPLLVEVEAWAGEDSVRLTAQRVEKLDGEADRRGGASLLEVRLSDAASALRLRGLLDGEGAGHGVRVRLVLGHGPDEEVWVALPEALTLPHRRRADLARLPGFVAAREVTLH